MKAFLHKSLRILGFDIVSSENLERELRKREHDRQKVRLQELQKLRDLQKKPNAPAGGEVVWTTREELIVEAIKRIKQVDVVVDIGCAFRPQQIVEAKTHICCEPYHEYMDRLIVETAAESKYVYVKADLDAATQLFPDASVDTVFMTEVIEHIDRDVGLEGLERLKRIARRQIVLSTPLGFMEQLPGEDGLDPWGMGGTEFQKHRSGWTPDDFPVSAGWTVIACNNYHHVDGYERAMDSSFGAFWAIWDSGR